MIVVALTAQSQVLAQTTNRAVPPSLTQSKDGWEQIDQRLVFLTVSLSSNETSLHAINKAIKVTGYQQSVKASDANLYRHGNEIMDRKGGGPKPWDEFYGKTAEKFFYHPVDPDTNYFNPLPISQRPPQLDYIYQANASEQNRATEEAAALGGKIDRLLERRRQLEAEQSALWCEIAFQAIASCKFPVKPIYRFDLKIAQTDTLGTERLEAARAACDFVRVINQLMIDAQRSVEANQEQVFQQFADIVVTARKSFIDRLSQQKSLMVDVGDRSSRVGKVAASVNQLDDLGANIVDSYHRAADGDKAADDQRKETFRGLLQEQLLSAAATLFTMDQCVSDLLTDWKLTPDVSKATAEPLTHFIFPPLINAHTQANDTTSVPAQSGSGFEDGPDSATKTPPLVPVSQLDDRNKLLLSFQDVLGRWGEHDGNGPFYVFTGDGRFMYAGNQSGAWKLTTNTLVLTWQTHGGQPNVGRVDTYNFFDGTVLQGDSPHDGHRVRIDKVGH